MAKKRTVKGKRGGAWSPSKRSRRKRDCQCAMIEGKPLRSGKRPFISMICGRLSRKYLRKTGFQSGVRITFMKCSAADEKGLR